MSTGNQNLDLLIKLLGQTTNDNENIAIMAMRKANEQLAKFNTTWEQILKGRVTIVADPFSDRAAPTMPSKPAPDIYSGPTPPRPAPHMPPRPQPAPAYTAPRPRPAHPMHQHTTTASPPPRDPNLGRPNSYDARCYTCSRDVPAGKGVLIGKTTTGKWKVECGQNFGHNAPHSQRGKRPAANASDLAGDLLG